jgi:NAD(P)-dependent dehydrogenase (short-subunit alcohol dehydrogenase family)
MRLKGKTALITGGNSGIGLATARRFVAEGARVAITGRDAATLAAAANELGVTAIRSDVLDAQARSSLFDRIKDEFGHLDILFANAGIAKFSPIEETLEKDFDDVLRTNVTAVFLTVQAALKLMDAGASIILNGSMAATTGSSQSSAYAASKAGVRAMCRSLAGERRLQAMIPLNRVGRAEDIANAVLFLASDEAAYIQGAELVVDGGVLGSAAAAPAHRR